MALASESFADVIAKVAASVVQIDTATASSSGQSPDHRGVGSGVIASPDGYVLTNAHVVKGAATIRVLYADGTPGTAKLVGYEVETDMAVLKLSAPFPAPAEFSDSDAVRVGDIVLAIGSPFGLGNTVTSGIISAKGRGLGGSVDFLQTDASINPGNSGGPLVNMQGKVIGINSLIIGRGQGIGFAIPANTALGIGQRIIANPRVPEPPKPPAPALALPKTISPWVAVAAVAGALTLATVIVRGRS